MSIYSSFFTASGMTDIRFWKGYRKIHNIYLLFFIFLILGKKNLPMEKKIQSEMIMYSKIVISVKIAL